MDDHFDICRVFEISKFDIARLTCICSAMKCPLEFTADDYFVTSNGAVYDAIQAAYIVLRIMGDLRISCLPCVCMFKHTTRYTQS